MSELITDPQGKVCTAKIIFICTVVSVLGKYLLGGMFGIPVFDATAAIALLSTTGAVYYGRNHTKAQNAN